METLRVKLTLIEPLLGTTSGNKELAKEFIAAKHPEGMQEDEERAMEDIEDVAEELEKSSTFFPKEDGVPFLWDYQLKGFFKDACNMLRRVPKTLSTGLKAYKKVIDGLVFPSPRKILINVSGEMQWTERPLRASTPQGERIALARSETVPAGSALEFDIKYMDPDLLDVILEWLEYGELRGLGQWRNSGMGRFSFEIIE